MGCLVTDLRRLYHTMEAGQDYQSTTTATPYRSFTAWQRDMLAGPRGDQLAAFWRRQVAEEWPGYEELYDRLGGARDVRRYAWQAFTFDAAMGRRLRDVARLHGLTLYGLLVSALQVLLYRYTGENDIVIASPVSGRKRALMERVDKVAAATSEESEMRTL